MTAETPPPATSSTAKWTLVLAAVASFMVALDTLVVSTALSTIRDDLGASIEQLEWTVNSYNLTFAVLLMAGAGALQGAGAAFVLPLALTVVSEAYPAERRGSAIGILFALTGLAVASGPVIGGAVTDGIAWEWIFWLNVPIGIAAVPLVLARIKESRGPDTGIDFPGLGLLMAGSLGIVWGLVRGNAAGWGSAEVVASLAAGLVLVAAFVAWERRAPEPMIPLRLFRSRAFAAGNTGSFFMIASLFGAVFFLAQFLQTGLGNDALGAGLRLMPWTATLFFVAPVAGALVDRFGERPFAATGLALQAAGMGWIALIAEPGMSYGSMVPALIVAGLGVSMAIPAMQNAVVGAVRQEEVGKASGVNNTMRELGGVFGIAVLVAVFSAAGSYASADAFVDGFGPAIGVTAAFSLLGAAAGLFIPSRRTTNEEEEMKRTIVRYRVKPDQAERNKELVRAVYDELHDTAPAGITYETHVLEDGVTFVHTAVEENGDSLTDLPAFAEFRREFAERVEAPPEALGATEVGSYRGDR
jgi:MFS family permease